MHRYTQEEREFIKAFAPGRGHGEIAAGFNERFGGSLSVGQIKAYLKNNKISTGRSGRFQKGDTPANKGTHRGGWEPTQFRKGNVPANHKPVGAESIKNIGARGCRYVHVKVAEPNKWRMKHVLVWEKHNGPVPKGKVIIFLDGNQLNTDIENLRVISRGIHAIMNKRGLRQLDAAHTESAIHVAELIEKTSAVGKGENAGRNKV